MVEWSKEVFARNLQTYMNRKGVNQKDLAEIVGVSCTAMNEWLKAKKYPRIDKIERLADYFGILKSDLIEDKKNPVNMDGLSENRKKLMQFVETVPDDKAEMILRVMKSILQDG